MKNEIAPLYIFVFRNPMESTEWRALRGSKYQQSLPFPLNFVDSPEKAQVVVWDAQLSAKLRHRSELIQKMISGKVLITNGAFSESGFAKDSIILPGVFNRPEELLSALTEAYKRVTHV